MLRYIAAAQALKFFSFNAATRHLYRQIGNRLGGKRRAESIEPHYIPRATENLAAIERAGGIKDGFTLLELGTGWVHWESLFTRLFYEVKITLFDVWDNRQFDGFLCYARILRKRLATEVDRPPEQIAKAEALLDEIIRLRDFEAVYERLGFTYLIDPQGRLAKVPSASIDLIISSDVLEHVPAQAVKSLIGEMTRVLKQGGQSANQIVPGDHLVIYDRKVNPKNYIRYSNLQWRWLFENEVQYVNRIQRSEWIGYFREAGFSIVDDAIVVSADIDDLKVSKRFEAYDRSDLSATVIRVIGKLGA